MPSISEYLSDFIHKHFDNGNYCAKCAAKYVKSTDKHKCNFCNKYFCSRHIATEEHNQDCSTIEKDYAQIKQSEHDYSVPYERLSIEELAKMSKSEKKAYLIARKLKFKEYHRQNFCTYCDKKYKDWTDAHQCRYCGIYFCSQHWVPESHGCTGNPERPPGGMREIHRADGGIDVYGK